MEELAKVFPPEKVEMFKKMADFKQFDLKNETYKGYRLIPGFSAACIEYAHDKWIPKSGDVFLASYPKTGTNWTYEILRRILYQDKAEDELSKAIPMPLAVLDIGVNPEIKFSLVDMLPLKRRLFGTHLPADLINMENIKKVNAKVVYVLRNPKDQIVSWYKFAQVAPPMQQEPMKSMVHSGWDTYMNHLFACDFPVHTKPGEWYPDNILSYHKYRDDKTVIFVYYEDLKQDLCGQVKRIADFLEAPMTDEKAAEISEACTFGNMKKDLPTDETLASKLRNLVMRKGEVGGWKNHFTVSQSERVDAMINEKLAGTDIRFKYVL